MEVQLEPLNVGPELDTIKEESLEGSGFSRRSSGSSRKNSSSVDRPSSGKSSERVENSASRDNKSKDRPLSGKSSERTEDSAAKDNRNKSPQSSADHDTCQCVVDSDGQSQHSDDNSVSDKISRYNLRLENAKNGGTSMTVIGNQKCLPNSRV